MWCIIDWLTKMSLWHYDWYLLKDLKMSYLFIYLFILGNIKSTHCLLFALHLQAPSSCSSFLSPSLLNCHCWLQLFLPNLFFYSGWPIFNHLPFSTYKVGNSCKFGIYFQLVLTIVWWKIGSMFVKFSMFLMMEKYHKME